MPNAECTRIRFLDADVFDCIELLAEEHGGIGGGKDFAYSSEYGVAFDFSCPVCVWGLVIWADGDDEPGDRMSRPLLDAGISRQANDDAVRRVNQQLGNGEASSRVPFELWRRELCIVRGPQPNPSPDATWPAPNKRGRKVRSRDEYTPAEASI